MAARRGKSQARRGGNGSLPGWMWLLIGAVLALVLVLIVPKYLKPDRSGDNFFRPRPNPEARPAISALDEADPPPARTATPRPLPAPRAEPEYDFYTVLPEQETALSDAELARLAAPRTPPAPVTPPVPSTHPDAAAPATPPVARAAAPARYLLQVGAFSNPAEAESLKAQIALLVGLQAKIEAGTVDGKPIHRVRLGPYTSAGELTQIKQRLGNGGLSAMAVRVE